LSSSMAAVLQSRPGRIRFLALIVITIAYTAVFSYLYEIHGSGVMPLSTAPVILVGWWYGFRPALACAAFVFAIDTVLIAGTFTPNLADTLEVGGAGGIALFLIGGVTGKMRDLSYQLRRELNERKRTEEELRQHRTNLEGLVSARTSELEEAVRQLQQEIAERKQVQDELKQSLEKEKRLNLLKSRFTSMVSHEFRTPLTVIQSCAEILETYADRMDEAKKADKFQTIQTQVTHMVELLGDILAFDRAESVGPAYNPEPLDLAAYCCALVDEFRLTAKTHRISVAAEPDAGKAMIDEALMRRAIWNLISNAVKYSPAGTAIEIGLARDGDQALISVKDHGIGVPEEDRKDLFEIFHRAHNVGSIQGTGLGLPIVKQAVLAHGGTIDFESKIGIGTTFTIKLPRVAIQENVAIREATVTA
jgi:signal transduction histidine kinase